jgi:hypothetical protein
MQQRRPAQFEDAFLAWTRAAFGPADAADAPRQVDIDGKTPLHLVSAFATREGVVLARATGRGRQGGSWPRRRGRWTGRPA